MFFKGHWVSPVMMSTELMAKLPLINKVLCTECCIKLQLCPHLCRNQLKIHLFIYAAHKIDLRELAVTYMFILPSQMLRNTVKKCCLILTYQKNPKNLILNKTASGPLKKNGCSSTARGKVVAGKAWG